MFKICVIHGYTRLAYPFYNRICLQMNTVDFNPPVSDGGDTIVTYNVSYSTTSLFTNSSSVLVEDLSGGSPFQSTISGLQTV